MREGSDRPGASPPFARAGSWEDPALLAALRVSQADDVAVFEPSGDDALALCAAGARAVVAFVPDAATAALVELKRAAARELPAQSARSFLGLGHFGRRVWFYHHLRPNLPPDVQRWGDAHEHLVRAGLAGQGAVEQAIVELRTRGWPLVLGRGAMGALLAAPGLEGQRQVVQRQWRGLRWRAVAPRWISRIARLAGSDGEGAAARLDALLDAVPVGASPFVRALLSGEAPDPEEGWLSPTTYAALKLNVASLRVSVGTRAVGLAAAGAFSAVVLGRRPLAADEGAALARGVRPGGRVLGWGAPPPSPFVLDAVTTRALAERDRGLFPGRPWLAVRD